MDKRSDDLSDDDLPQPGTEEPTSTDDDSNSVDGPGNVSVDEPTAPALEDDEDEPHGEDSDSEE